MARNGLAAKALRRNVVGVTALLTPRTAARRIGEPARAVRANERKRAPGLFVAAIAFDGIRSASPFLTLPRQAQVAALVTALSGFDESPRLAHAAIAIAVEPLALGALWAFRRGQVACAGAHRGGLALCHHLAVSERQPLTGVRSRWRSLRDRACHRPLLSRCRTPQQRAG
jgi:hypothetical protein